MTTKKTKVLIMKTNMMKIYSTSMLLGLFLLAASMLPVDAQAQIQEIDQSIYGMDCAPCAYGVENRLKKMDGVITTDLSLNEGKAVAELATENSITLEGIRDAIRRNGFDAKDATLRLKGTLSQEGETWILSLSSGEKFQLDQYENVISERELQERSGQETTLTGHVPEGYNPPEKGWVLHIMEFDVQQTPRS